MAVRFEPDYYRNFQCKCGQCRHTCCKGWQIDISRREYFRLIGMECSEALHRKIESAFAVPERVSEDAFRMIAPNWLGSCPMLDSDGLCMLQKECGEAALPTVCREYPRSLQQEGHFRHACCSGSCEAVVELLMKEEQVLFRLTDSRESPLLQEPVDESYPELFLRCMGNVQNRQYSIPQRINHIADLLSQPLRLSADDIRGMLPTLLDFSPELQDYLKETEDIDPRIEENLLANHFLYVNFPYTDPRITKADSAIGLQVLHFLLSHAGNNADGLAAVFHLAEHTAFYYNAKVLSEKAAL